MMLVVRGGAALVVLVACGKPTVPAGAHDDARRTDGGAASTDAAAPARLVAYVGGYGPNIGWYDVGSDGTLAGSGSIAADTPSPSFLAITRTTVYAVSEANSRIGAYAIDPATDALTFIDDASSGGTGPAFAGVDRSGAYVLAANYTDGSVASLATAPDGGVGAPATLALGKNAHMIVTDPSNHFALAPCLGSDFVAQLTFDPATGALALGPVPHFSTATGAGPRHLAFAPDGVHVYLVDETASVVEALSFDPTTGQLSRLQTQSTRAPSATGTNTGAEIWVHPAGRYVYVSNRGDDTIGVFAVGADAKLTQLAQTSTRGMTPRDFTLTPAGDHLYVTDQSSNALVAFAIDASTGLLSPIGTPIDVTMPSFVGITERGR